MILENAIKQREFTDEAQKAVINILYTGSWLTYIQSGIFKKYDLSMQQFNVLRILRGQHPKTATVNLLIERMIDQSSNASRIVEKLVQKGLVERKSCPQDRRRVDVGITEEGLKLLAEASDGLIELQKKLLCLSQEEYRQLNALLDKMRTNQ